MDRRELPINMRPHICRVTPQSQTLLKPEPPIMLTPGPLPSKGKKAAIPQPPPPSEPSKADTPGVQVIRVVGKEQWINKG